MNTPAFTKISEGLKEALDVVRGGNWQEIDGNVRYGTIADLLMESGRVYRAVWEYRGRCCAWWPQSRQRKRPIGLYNPIAMRVVAAGIGKKL